MGEGLFDLAGRTALVTGGSRGIGAMIAQGLVESGVRTYISSRKADACEDTARQLSAFGSCYSLPADLSTDDGARALGTQLAEREAELHILVNNAGATWGAPLRDYPAAAFDKLWNVNVKSAFRLTTELLPLMSVAGTSDAPARVINIGSIEGLTVSRVENYAYGASKAALHHLTRLLAARLAAEHVTVNAVAPGPFHTKMTAYALDDPVHRDVVADAIPLGRIGAADDVAGTVIYLCSRAGAYLTGTVIPLDGGLSTTVRH